MARRFKVGDVVMIGEQVKPELLNNHTKWPTGAVGVIDEVNISALPPLLTHLGEKWDWFAASELHYIGRL